MDIAVTVSRTLSFVVGLALAGMATFAALGEEIPTGKTEYHHVGEDIPSPRSVRTSVITTQIDGSPLQLDSTSGRTGAPAVWKCKDNLSEQKLEDYLEKCTRSKACDISLAKKICETESLPPSPETIQLRDIAARLYRIETLLREMCADATAPFAECAALWQQQ